MARCAPFPSHSRDRGTIGQAATDLELELIKNVFNRMIYEDFRTQQIYFCHHTGNPSHRGGAQTIPRSVSFRLLSAGCFPIWDFGSPIQGFLVALPAIALAGTPFPHSPSAPRDTPPGTRVQHSRDQSVAEIRPMFNRMIQRNALASILRPVELRLLDKKIVVAVPSGHFYWIGPFGFRCNHPHLHAPAEWNCSCDTTFAGGQMTRNTWVAIFQRPR
jgi:hypothetical protein